MILFINTISTDKRYVQKIRKRSAKIFTNAYTSRVSFDNLTVKKLFISDFIDLYNHFMNDVNVTNQLWCYYNTQRVYLKIWKPLWHFLLNITMCNSYKILNITEQRSYAELRKHEAHKVFRMQLIEVLFERSERIKPSEKDLHDFHKRLTQLIRQTFVMKHDRITKIVDKDFKYCVSCSVTDRKTSNSTIRKSLQNLFFNSIEDAERRQRPSKIAYDCKLYAMPICNKIGCWNEHIEAITI